MANRSVDVKKMSIWQVIKSAAQTGMSEGRMRAKAEHEAKRQVRAELHNQRKSK